MKLTFCLILVFLTNVLSESRWNTSAERNVESLPRKSLKALHGSIKSANRRHIEHVDAKWDTSDMDSDESTPSTVETRRTILLHRDKNLKSTSHFSLSKIMPYIRTLLAEIVKRLADTKWEAIGKSVLGIVDGLINIIYKTENPSL